MDLKRWGLPLEIVLKLSARLVAFGQWYRVCFKARTRDGSHYAYHYLSGLLWMDTRRNFVNKSDFVKLRDVEEIKCPTSLGLACQIRR